MPHARLFAALLLLPLCGIAGASVRHYQAPLATVKWQTAAAEKHCSLRHDIPHYGQAVFSQAAGRTLEFRLLPRWQATREHDRARLRSQPPGWRPRRDALDLGEVPVQRGSAPFQLDAAQARRLLAELEKGMMPTFSYRDWADARDRVDVALPGVNFRSALDDFSTCLSRLPVYDFNDFRHSLLHFDFGKTELDTDARQRLDALATYLATDPTVKRVLIDGHTDDVGQDRDNDQLAASRSRAIRDYLQAKGIPPALFELRSHGEQEPIYTNTTEQGRARNRRAQVTLIR